MAIVVPAGQRGDSPQFEPVLEKVRVPRVGLGRPRVRPDRVRADKAYASRRNRAYLRRRGIRCTTPDQADQARNRQKLRSRAGHRVSSRSIIVSVMRSSAGSTASRGTALSPPGRTSLPSATRRLCWSRPSTNGCDQDVALPQAHTALTTAWPAEAACP
ncbi:transposase [Streptomyces sp. B6(2022)]|uniref:transposase n=1 Tax=Streptomyces sp. B6(2022) TaxID=3404749 RepID=UPI003AF0A176